MTTPTIGKVVCGTSIEPLREWIREPGWRPCGDLVKEAIKAYDDQTAELSRLRSENERLQEMFRLLDGKCKELEDALKKAKCAFLEIEVHCPCGARPESLNTHPHVGGCPVSIGLTVINSLNL